MENPTQDRICSRYSVDELVLLLKTKTNVELQQLWNCCEPIVTLLREKFGATKHGSIKRLHTKYRWLETLNLEELIDKVQATNITNVAKELKVPRHVLQSHLNRNGFFQDGKFKRTETTWNKGLTKEDPRVLKNSLETSKTVKQKYEDGYVNPFKGKHHTEEYKQQSSDRELSQEYQDKRTSWVNEHKDFLSECGKKGGREKGFKQPDSWKVDISNKLQQQIKSGNNFFLKGVKSTRVKESKLEKKFREELEKRKIKFQQEYVLLSSVVDFYLLDFNICIYVDGCYVHGCHQCFHWNEMDLTKPRNLVAYQSPLKDQRITKILTENSYKVYRFWEHDINQDVSKCVDQIKF